MPRLRVTATLSLLMLLSGVAATAWLSAQTAGRATPPVTGPRAASAHLAHHYRAHGKSAVRVRPFRYTSMQAQAAVAPPADAVTLVPVSMPSSSLPVARMQHHDVGTLVLYLHVDGQGQVIHAAVAQSSGDGELDANAMALARHWRFAVPADHPQGISGNLPMRFLGKSVSQAQTL